MTGVLANNKARLLREQIRGLLQCSTRLIRSGSDHPPSTKQVVIAAGNKPKADFRESFRYTAGREVGKEAHVTHNGSLADIKAQVAAKQGVEVESISNRKAFKQVPVDSALLSYITSEHLALQRGSRSPPAGESGIGLRFIGAAKSVASIPTHPAPLAEVAFVGRSNVGKSSLLNALATKYIANTSAIPGKTQSLNFYGVGNGKLTVVDLPGYGFAFAKPELVFDWMAVMDGYLKTRVPLKRVFVLLDARHGLKVVDKRFIATLEASCRPYQFVLTKCDLVLAPDLARRAYLVRQEANALAYAQKEVLLVSAKYGCGMKKLIDIVKSIAYK